MELQTTPKDIDTLFCFPKKHTSLFTAYLPSHHLFIVEFKAGRTAIFYHPLEPLTSHTLCEGELVLTEVEQGIDLGKIKKISKETVNDILMGTCKDIQLDPDVSLGRIVRKPTFAEIYLLIIKSYDEKVALKFCQNKIKDKQLKMSIVQVEYQW